jgi:hypothetical protein
VTRPLIRSRRSPRGGLFALFLALALIARIAAPSIVKTQLIARLEKACPRCSFEIGSIQLDVLHTRATALKLKVKGDPHDSSQYWFDAEGVRVDFKLDSLWTWALDAGSMQVDGFHLTLSENGDTPPKPPSRFEWVRNLPKGRVEDLHVRDSSFTYIRTHLGKPARVVATHVSFDSGPVGTRRELSPLFVEAHAQASTPSGGSVWISGKFGLYEEEKIDNLQLTARDVDLSDLNSYFVPAEGVRVEGRLLEGNVDLRVRKKKLAGQIALKYAGLKLHFISGENRQSPVAAFFKTLIAPKLVAKNKMGNSQVLPHVEVATVQKPEQNVFSFILTGLQKAVEAIARS